LVLLRYIQPEGWVHSTKGVVTSVIGGWVFKSARYDRHVTLNRTVNGGCKSSKTNTRDRDTNSGRPAAIKAQLSKAVMESTEHKRSPQSPRACFGSVSLRRALTQILCTG